MTTTVNLIGKKLRDSEGNIFFITEYTYSADGKKNGYTLKGNGGEKEISKYDLNFYGFMN